MITTKREESMSSEERVVFDGVETRNSRVLVNNQKDPSENGIYITSKYEWSRAEDAHNTISVHKKEGSCCQITVRELMVCITTVVSKIQRLDMMILNS